MISGLIEVVQLVNKGVLHRAILRLGKHGIEQALQRISKLVVEACRIIGLMLNTKVPDLRSWFAEGRNKIRTPLFIFVSNRVSILC